MRPRLLADASLIGVTLVWGTTFVVVKLSVVTVDPLVFVAARFLVGALALVVIYWRTLGSLSLKTWRAGALLGFFLFAGFALQTFGLQVTTPARAAFITGLNVVLVPLLAALLTRERPRRTALAGVALSTIGLVALSAPLSAAELRAGDWVGDLLVLGCALAFAVHIVGVGHYAGRHSAPGITTIQVGAVALFATGAAWLGGGQVLAAGEIWPAILYMGVVATALVFLLQNWAQVHTPPTHTALIFALEPVFAALFSAGFYGEAITPRSALGGALIVAGMLVAELRVRQAA